MTLHSSLKLGGPADYFCRPKNRDELLLLVKICRDNDIPWMILGGGANILVADRGIRGLVIHTADLNRIERHGNTMIVEAGCDVSQASLFAMNHELQGLQWIYRMPGSLGGAIWMNARCYGSEISQILQWVEILTTQGKIERQPFDPGQWAYKKSPYQQQDLVILGAALTLGPGDKKTLQWEMKEIEADRIHKGHFKKPSAGSTFKNDRTFGAPSGKIIDLCGLRGISQGGAAVSSWHGNILINQDSATSADFLALIKKVQQEVLDQKGFLLEPEVLTVGDWG